MRQLRSLRPDLRGERQVNLRAVIPGGRRPPFKSVQAAKQFQAEGRTIIGEHPVQAHTIDRKQAMSPAGVEPHVEQHLE